MMENIKYWQNTSSNSSVWWWYPLQVNVENKRVVGGYSLGTMRLQDFFDPKSYGGVHLYNKAFSKFIQMAREDVTILEKASKLGFENFLVALAHSVVNVDVKYRYDSERFKRVDFWETASEVANWNEADCEGAMHYLQAGIENILDVENKNDGKRSFATYGYYRDFSKKYWGHAYILFYNSHFNRWTTLEPTEDRERSPFIWLNWNPEKYIPCIIASRRYTYVVHLSKEAQKLLGIGEDYINEHRGHMQAMYDYVITGQRLTLSWRHKTSDRKVPIDMEDLLPVTF